MKAEATSQLKDRNDRVREEARQTWESYKERMRKRKVISEKLWWETKFIRPEEKLESYEEWENDKNYFLDNMDPLNEGLECHRNYTVSFPDKPSKEVEVISFIVEFESKLTTVKEVRLSSFDSPGYHLPNERRDRKPELRER